MFSFLLFILLVLKMTGFIFPKDLSSQYCILNAINLPGKPAFYIRYKSVSSSFIVKAERFNAFDAAVPTNTVIHFSTKAFIQNARILSTKQNVSLL